MHLFTWLGAHQFIFIAAPQARYYYYPNTIIIMVAPFALGAWPVSRVSLIVSVWQERREEELVEQIIDVRG